MRWFLPEKLLQYLVNAVMIDSLLMMPLRAVKEQIEKTQLKNVNSALMYHYENTVCNYELNDILVY